MCVRARFPTLRFSIPLCDRFASVLFSEVMQRYFVFVHCKFSHEAISLHAYNSGFLLEILFVNSIEYHHQRYRQHQHRPRLMYSGKVKE